MYVYVCMYVHMVYLYSVSHLHMYTYLMYSHDVMHLFTDSFTLTLHRIIHYLYISIHYIHYIIHYLGLSACRVALVRYGPSAEPTVTIGIHVAYILILSILHIIYMLDRDVLYTGLFTIQHIHIVYYCAHTAYIHTYMHLLHTIVPTLYTPSVIYSYTSLYTYICKSSRNQRVLLSSLPPPRQQQPEKGAWPRTEKL